LRRILLFTAPLHNLGTDSWARREPQRSARPHPCRDGHELDAEAHHLDRESQFFRNRKRSYDAPELSADDPERRLLREFSNRKDLAKRMEGLRLQGERIAARKRTGKSEGAKRYGERAGEEAVMGQIRDMHQKGLGNTEISRRLNDQNIPPRRGKKWHPTTIANVLDARRNAAVRKARRGAKKSTR
jgi:hypothetical protein